MSIYEGLKDAISIAQKADNIDLYRKLLDLSRDALDLQDEIDRLRQEVSELRNINDLESKIKYHRVKYHDALTHDHPYITLLDDTEEIRYCAICWGRDKKLIPLYDDLNCLECSRL